MDNSWEKQPYPFLLRSFFILIAVSVLTFTIIRQVRTRINSDYIYPAFAQISESYDTQIIFSPRRINILTNNNDPPRGFGIPFGGYFWLPFTLLFISRDKKIAFGLTCYHLFLCIGPPYVALLFIKGSNLAGTFLQINELIFILVFLSSLLLATNNIYNMLKNKRPL